MSLSLAIDTQDLTPPVFQHQLSLAIDLHQNELSQASNLSMDIQLSLIKDRA